MMSCRRLSLVSQSQPARRIVVSGCLPHAKHHLLQFRRSFSVPGLDRGKFESMTLSKTQATSVGLLIYKSLDFSSLLNQILKLNIDLECMKLSKPSISSTPSFPTFETTLPRPSMTTFPPQTTIFFYISTLLSKTIWKRRSFARLCVANTSRVWR